MDFHVLTLFPEMITQGMQTSIFGRAVKSGCITLETVNIRDYTKDRHKKADDYPYGGGAGMLMQAQPVSDAFEAVKEKLGGKKTRVIFLTPQGVPFCQKMAEELSGEETLVFLCGHYEGIDERVLQEIVTDYVSIGDFVLTGGELPAMVMMDAIARLIPGVLNNNASASFETFYNDLLEYPQYTRPEEWHGRRVPEVLLSGDHGKVEKWRLEQSVKRTEKNRPDLYKKYMHRQHYIEKMRKTDKWLYMDMIENLRRGRGELLYAAKDGLLVCDRQARTCMLSAVSDLSAAKVVEALPQMEGVWQFVAHQQCLLAPLKERFSVMNTLQIRQAVYPQKVPLPVSRFVEIRPLTPDHRDVVTAHYSLEDPEYITERLTTGNIYGAFSDGELAGFAGIHAEGSLGILEVFEAYRKRGIGMALEAFLINLHLSRGYVPYGDVVNDNNVSFRLQEKLGLRISDSVMYWVTAERQGRAG